jgi:outer membrane lipoprotein-sorting protein
MILRKFTLVWLLWGLTAAPAPAALSATDQSDISRAETYLNSVTTLSARFLQVAANGDTAEGTLSLSRPGHLRLDYDPPSPILIIANDDWLIYRDKQLDQTSYLDIGSSPAGLLIKPQLKLDGNGLTVTTVVHRPGVLEISVVKQKDPRQGTITLIFSDMPFQLRQWHVTDAQGQMTSVSLFDPHFDASFARGWFEVKAPNPFEPH